jgi:23S rRNA pseudouridine2604 synthase
MCKVLGYKVIYLERVRIMNIHVQGIASGSWRFLTDAEIDGIMSEIQESKSEGSTRSRKSFSKSRAKKPGKYIKESGSGEQGASGRVQKGQEVKEEHKALGSRERGAFGRVKKGQEVQRGQKDKKETGSRGKSTGGRKSGPGTRGGAKKSGGRR